MTAWGRRAISAIKPRGSTWICCPSTPRVPGGPSGRLWPTPKRRISIEFGLHLQAPLAASALRLGRRRSRPDRRLGMRGLRPLEVALTSEALLIDPDQRREMNEADPDVEEGTTDHRRQSEDEVEIEDREHQQQREDPNRGPHQPLIEVQEDRIGMQPAALEVVEDDGEHEQP